MAKKSNGCAPSVFLAGCALDGVDITACVKQANSLQFLVCGKTGVGKSSLVNSLVGFEVCHVGDPGESLDGCTAAVEATAVNIDGVPVFIYDSPGLQDGGPDEEKYLQDIHANCKNVDLVLYCVDMTNPRYTAAEIRTAELLTEKLGETFWEHCVLVMTKANSVRVPRSERGKERAYHQGCYTNLLEKFRKQLIKQGVPQITADAIPAVAAGLYDPDVDEADPDNERYVWYTSDKAEPSDHPTDFLTELWVTCFETMRGSAQQKYVRATLRQRIKPLGIEPQLKQLLKEREEAMRGLCNEFEQKFREQQGRHQEELEKLKEEFSAMPKAPPPPYDSSCPLMRLDRGHEQRILIATEKENAAVQAAVAVVDTGVGFTAGAMAGGAIGLVGGPVGVAVGAGIGAAVGGVLGLWRGIADTFK